MTSAPHPRRPLPHETTRFTLRGHRTGARVRPGDDSYSLGHRPTEAEARQLIPIREAEGWTVTRLIERRRDYPFATIRNIPL